ncbi:MAG TPA: glutamate synthase subunit beta [Anaerohalosphaeraceae bacterium]|nr:glutamate synthase subunit beta [Anaerohalosphaeraceae bacterium]HOL30734.1 glutamate synthase subunit beta [Anaerohalosphaeraceae bacterium]HOM76454.1 glutamate synthase subunit beta [Anaerohalosphaeraceae bacterium]HPC64565.1 glutamate synthase subunit beta [Anaerohalosphaeraceae bacterium]HPO70889.1 glutamate synthase subunit beta [Anaerohalosphaeraceae bacterium]
MAKIKGFLEYPRQSVPYRPVEERIGDYREIEIPLTPEAIVQQAARCADCGIPFCHGAGCPLGNLIPEFNELIYSGKWKEACEVLHATNNFPEITGRVCPAPCETACTLAVNDKPVLIRHIECQIVERGFREGWIVPLVPRSRTGKTVAVVGSGPAGLAAAQQLARAGHKVTVFERENKPGGLLRYGIPDFKLEKWILDRRLKQMSEEGVEFETQVHVGQDISASYLCRRFDAVCLTAGACQPRDLNIPGRGYENIVFAMDFLRMQNKINAGETAVCPSGLHAAGKNVVVIGGGDTGSDCVGTARRQGAKSITQIEILPQPPETRPPDTPWPMWPRTMRTSSSHEEGCRRMWSILTKQFSGTEIRVSRVHCVRVEWKQINGQWKFTEVPGSEFTLDADLVLLALGFVHVEHGPLVTDLGLKLDDRGNIAVTNCQTSNPKVFAAGDAVSGASLVVRAIHSGRIAANAVDQYLRMR